MDLLADLEARSLVQDSTDRDALRARINEGPVGLYYGCDPSADSLHVGNLIGLLVLRRFADAGHNAIALAGGATGMIGDPGGRSRERNLLDAATLARNNERIAGQIERISRVRLVDNLDWTGPVTLLDFLRDVGKHANVNQMISRESVKARLESENGISFTEFSYQLLQANDYRHLFRAYGVELQIGGSDQWGNLLAGVDLIRRADGGHVHAFTWPLLLRSDGKKFGKSEEGAVWLAADRTSPYQFFQYWMNVPDADVERFLLQLTLLPVEEAQAVAAAHLQAPNKREGQRRLAREVTTLVHGEEATAAAEQASAILFGGSPVGAPMQASQASWPPRCPPSRSRRAARSRRCWPPPRWLRRCPTRGARSRRAPLRQRPAGAGGPAAVRDRPCCMAAGRCCARESARITCLTRPPADGPRPTPIIQNVRGFLPLQSLLRLEDNDGV